jgi:hypothetical protein
MMKQKNQSPISTSTVQRSHDISTTVQSKNEPELSENSVRETDNLIDHIDTKHTSDEPTVKQRPVGWFSSWFRSTTSSSVVEQQPLYDDSHGQQPNNSGCHGDEYDDENVEELYQDMVQNNLQNAACMPPSVSTNNALHKNDVMVHPLSDGITYENDGSENSILNPQDNADDNQTASSFAGNDCDTGDNDLDDDDDDDDDDDFIDIDYTANENPLVLKLGRDGTIGILDVRLVGKTIHVLIEDADLTIEVVRQSAGGYETSTPSPQQQQQQQKQAAAAAANKKKMAADASSSTAALKTPGDRLLAENIIARYLSIVPNLFLRDVRIRLIIHEDEAVQSHPPNTHNRNEHGDDTKERSNDSVVEVVIGLFSVNDGKDFLLNFAGEFENDADDDNENVSDEDNDVELILGQGSEPTTVDGIHTSIRSSDGLRSMSGDTTTGMGNTNEFLSKRIRTGRGPEGGIVVRIYPAACDDTCCELPMHNKDGSNTIRWAHEMWQSSSEYVLLRCSGLDAQAQIFLGTKKEIAIQNYGYYSEESQYDNFTVDAMLFGVDYIVPGPQPPLPKISNAQHILPNPLDAEGWANTGSTTFVADTNGIQSCRIASPFHKVARGMIPCHCMGTHLPSESCHYCWKKEGGSCSPHILDASTPLGGFIVHLSIRDPLSINVDRYNLSVLGRLISIFTKRNHEENSSNDGFDRDQNIASEIPVGSNHSIKSHSSTSTVLAPSYQSIDDSGRSAINGRRISKTQSMKQLDDKTINAAFPTYMKPEKIQMTGLYIADVEFRVHILRRNRNLEYGRSFSFWEICAKCVTLDLQNLSAKERPFQDIRFDVAYLTVHQLIGVDRKQLISLGIRPRSVEFDDATVDMFTEGNRTQIPWPTTSATILDITPPLESMIYADREYHGLQIRYLAVLDPSETVNRSRKDLNIRIGTALVDVEFRVKDEIMIVISEGVASVIGSPKRSTETNTANPPLDSILKYKVVSDGGKINLKPLISADLPRTISQGEISKSAGFSVESFLDEFRIAYGRPLPIRMLDQGLSLQQLAKLPDNVRLRVLLFLRDLKPLESALGRPDTPNSFMRCRAVNNGIVQLAKRNMKMSASSETISECRRQTLIGELMSLDDDTLDQLLSVHRRRKEKYVFRQEKL